MTDGERLAAATTTERPAKLSETVQPGARSVGHAATAGQLP